MYNIRRHKTFISNHHAKDEGYKNEFKRLFSDIHVELYYKISIPQLEKIT
jgi:hypothetical protein